MELGVTRGESVGLLMPNCLEFIPTQYGIWKSGAAMVQMQARASANDLLHFLTTSGATTLIYHDKFDDVVAGFADRCPSLRRLIRLSGARIDGAIDYAQFFGAQPDHPPAVDVQPDDLALIMYTSGSTGTPKGVRHTHRSWGTAAIVAGMEIGDIAAGEVFAHGAPLTHFTQIFVLPTMMRGGTTVVLPGLDVDLLLDTIERHRVTAIALVPTVIYVMLAHPRRTEADLSSLRTVVYAGSPMAPDRLREAVDVFGQVFVQAYAGTEPGFMSCLRKEDHRVDTSADVARLASAGRVMYHVELTIQDGDDNPVPTGVTGEICARQDGAMIGYLDSSKDDEALRNGWVHSGDIGYLDEDGYLFIVDRKKDMVVTGGFNVFPRQIEDVLMSHRNVAQCAVIGIPDDKWGEAVKAVVVRAVGSTVTDAELIALVKERKGSVWAPKSVDFVDSLPVNASGKLDKKTLKAPYWVGHSRLVH
ncbi:long-chain fatty acid--CoA ligase [Tsukamurella soli]|uniref:Long-chain fatty acid--CoA ligase n=1 Tax=Tsukamurella soli TaxID=644556 RepID=A0ABP8J669_9ACTN